MSRFSYDKIEIKKDCKSYMKEGICKLDGKPYRQPCDALDELVCKNNLCPFYKKEK